MVVYRLDNLPETADKFVFDTNVLLFLHGFFYRDRKITECYAKIANYIITNNSTVYIDIVALSEFINRYISDALPNKLGQDGKDFRFKKREHRNTDEYKEVIGDLRVVLKQITDAYNVHFVYDGYNNFDIGHALFSLNAMEFNDYLISLVAKKYHAYLVTHDRDIVDSCKDIAIVTALT